MKMTPSAVAMRNLRIRRREAGMCCRCGRKSKTLFCRKCKLQLKSYKKVRVKNAFRKPKKWTVTNHTLYNYMVENNISAARLAQMVGTSERTVLRWVFEKATPKEPAKSKVESLVGEDVF